MISPWIGIAVLFIMCLIGYVRMSIKKANFESMVDGMEDIEGWVKNKIDATNGRIDGVEFRVQDNINKEFNNVYERVDELKDIFQDICEHKFKLIHNEISLWSISGLINKYEKECKVCGYLEEITEKEYYKLKMENSEEETQKWEEKLEELEKEEE